MKQILCEHIRAVEDSENRTLVYSLKSAAQNGKVFGQFRAVAPNGDKILVENESGVADIYDTSNLQSLVRFLFPSRIVHARFASNGDTILVLTADQTVYKLKTSVSTHKRPLPSRQENMITGCCGLK